MSFLNAAFLFGLAALAIPPLVHLLNRRRYEIVPWAAVMFLPESTTTQRRFRFQHLPLMIQRMGLLAILVFAFAAPQFSGCQSKPSQATPRDILILIDGSASMARGLPGQTPADRAKAYVAKWLDDLGPQQRIAIRTVKQRTLPVLDDFTADRALARNSLELLPKPSGTADWPAAIQQAYSLLEGRTAGEIVVLTDDQKFGWADDGTLTKWGLLAQAEDCRVPIHVVTFANASSGEKLNARLEPIRTDRATAVAGREIPFRSNVRFQGERGPTSVRISVDGSPANTVNIAPAEGENAVPVLFSHRFAPGSHLVSFELPDDAFPGDNRQDYAFEVLPMIPVLILDGGAKRSSDFLRDALAPQKDTTPAYLVRTVGFSDWQPGLLQRNLGGPNTAPRAVVLMNIDAPTTDQARQVEKFLRDGGSVFVTLGETCNATAWNRIAYRGGEGFLPARVVGITQEASPDSPAQVPRPATAGFAHPALEIFKEPLPGGLATASFPKYWKLDPNAGAKGATGASIAAFTNGDPWLIESNFGAGRAIMSAHPFDDSWKTNLHRLPDFVRLSHELLYYLSGNASTRCNLLPGQPILFRPNTNEPPGEVRIRMPDGRIRHRTANAWPLVLELDGEPGAYQLTTSMGRQSWYAVEFDARESDPTANSPQDRAKVAGLANPLDYVAEYDPVVFESRSASEPWNFWWILLAVVFAMLLMEVFVTRKLVRSGEHAMPEGTVR